MSHNQGRRGKKVGLVFTRYPVATETFLQREVQALREMGQQWEVVAMWGRENAGFPTDLRFYPRYLLSLIWSVPYWLWKRPRAMQELAKAVVFGRIPTMTNYLENLLGVGMALCWARRLEARYNHLHAVWASAPGSLVWAVNALTGLPFSLAGHAYDLFEGGGDGWLKWKIPGAQFIRSSTEKGCLRWRLHGAQARQLHLIRRGLVTLPEELKQWQLTFPVRFLAVGRMVEKMGYGRLVKILTELNKKGLSFEMRIVGDGPLRDEVSERLRSENLIEKVTLLGALPYSEVEQQYIWAQFFIFAGQVARGGDQAGFPNAIGEAMAWGVPVAATCVGGIGEVIKDGYNGVILSSHPRLAAQQIMHLLGNPAKCEQYRKEAREWIQRHFKTRENMAVFAGLIDESKRVADCLGGYGPWKPLTNPESKNICETIPQALESDEPNH